MITAAVIGLGWWGSHIVSRLADGDKVLVTHGFDPDVAKANEVAAKYGFQVAADYDTVLGDGKVDAVIVATPHGLHEEQVLAAVTADKHVFCEKPVALNAAGARRIVAACRRHGRILGVGHERRFEGALVKVKQLVDEGGLGDLIHVESNWSHNALTRLDNGNWRKNPVHAPAGLLTGLGIHITDYFQTIAGPVATVSARTVAARKGASVDVITVQFAFEGGATGWMCNIQTTPFYCRITAFGDKGWAETRRDENVDVAVPATLDFRDLSGQPQRTTFAPDDPVRANIHEWADAVEGRATYRFTADEILHNIAILESIVASAAQGKPVRVSDVASHR